MDTRWHTVEEGSIERRDTIACRSVEGEFHLYELCSVGVQSSVGSSDADLSRKVDVGSRHSSCVRVWQSDDDLAGGEKNFGRTTLRRW